MRNAILSSCFPLALAAVAGQAQAQDSRTGLEATVLLQQAAGVVDEMKVDPAAAGLLHMAQGVFVVPDFAQAAVVIGGWGGNGVLLGRVGEGWGSPAFYDIAAVTAGAQIGFTSGPVVMLLMSDAAVDAFRTGGEFSLGASAGFTVVDIAAGAEASTRGDVVIWSDDAGIYAGLAASASDIDWDEGANAGYYGREVAPAEVISGQAGGSAVAAEGPDALTTALDG